MFVTETVRDRCLADGIAFTRCRTYRRNHQARVDLKNGAVVRRSVGYPLFAGMTAARELAALYARARLFENGFRPSFKLAE